MGAPPDVRGPMIVPRLEDSTMQNRKAVVTIIAAAVATVIVAGACGGSGDTSSPTQTPAVSKIVRFGANLSAAQEVPTPTGRPSGTGTFSATLDTSTNVFTYTVTYSGMTPNVTAGHIHGPAGAGTPAAVILNFTTLPGATFATGSTSGTASGTVVLNAATTISAAVNGDSLKKLLFAGLTYANIHTNTNGAGEIRGQITKQ